MRQIIGINEQAHIFHKTSKLSDSELHRLVFIAAVIRKYFIKTSEWELRCEKGSLTFQKETDRHEVIKLLIDHNWNLCANLGMPARHDEPDPVFIGVELTHHHPLVRDAIRDRLEADLGWQYFDPRKASTKNPAKVKLNPVKDSKDNHYYDGIVLPEGKCPDWIKVTEADLEATRRCIVEGKDDPQERPCTPQE